MAPDKIDFAPISNPALRTSLRNTLDGIVSARHSAVAALPEWEQLRETARRIKQVTLTHLDSYLEQLEAAVKSNGGQVVWAENAEDATRFTIELARRNGILKVVKSKSMLGEEIAINAALEKASIEPIETDLGEFIVQLARETPYHLVAPALHKTRQDVRKLFVEKLQMEDTEDVTEITATARHRLRKEFLAAGMGITGVNFGVAETGTIVVVENEGNARLSLSLPRIHVAIMGIEKVIPRLADLSVFLPLLTRSATGQTITSYVNLVQGPRRPGEIDGPEEFYLVLVDNGRSAILQDPFFRQTLACIRCGACLNVCPVYRTIGGHSYGSVYQGPIGKILTPQLLSLEETPQHPFASSLCGACADVCPVKIEIPHLLLELRHQVQTRRHGAERWAWWCWSHIVRSPALYSLASRLARLLPGLILGNRFSPARTWRRNRELADLAPRRFRDRFGREEEP